VANCPFLPRLEQVPLFALLDKDELAILAAQVEMKTFAPR
jgi:CRP/FNR family transcriptional regulator, cyclic AMP receptor protein